MAEKERNSRLNSSDTFLYAVPPSTAALELDHSTIISPIFELLKMQTPLGKLIH